MTDRDRISAEVLDEIEGALAKAHTLPWHVDPDDRAGMEWNNHICAGPLRVAFMSHDGAQDTGRGEASAALIVAVVNALPALLAEVSAARAAQALPSVEETGWLLEMRGRFTAASPSWWTLDDGPGWTTDSLKALRFARKEDAQAYIDETGWTEVFPSEHVWCDCRRGALLPTPPQAGTALPSVEKIEQTILQEIVCAENEGRRVDELRYTDDAARAVLALLPTPPQAGTAAPELSGAEMREAAVQRAAEVLQHSAWSPTVTDAIRALPLTHPSQEERTGSGGDRE